MLANEASADRNGKRISRQAGQAMHRPHTTPTTCRQLQWCPPAGTTINMAHRSPHAPAAEVEGLVPSITRPLQPHKVWQGPTKAPLVYRRHHNSLAHMVLRMQRPPTISILLLYNEPPTTNQQCTPSRAIMTPAAYPLAHTMTAASRGMPPPNHPSQTFIKTWACQLVQLSAVVHTTKASHDLCPAQCGSSCCC